MKFLNKRRKGFGGVFFIVCVALGAFIMITVISLSRINTMRAVADNTAFVVATKVAIHSYSEGLNDYSVSGDGTVTGSPYSPLQDFNNMMSGYGMVESGSSKMEVSWDNTKGVATVITGPFESIYGDSITPYIQSTSIENE